MWQTDDRQDCNPILYYIRDTTSEMNQAPSRHVQAHQWWHHGEATAQQKPNFWWLGACVYTYEYKYIRVQNWVLLTASKWIKIVPILYAKHIRLVTKQKVRIHIPWAAVSTRPLLLHSLTLLLLQMLNGPKACALLRLQICWVKNHPFCAHKSTARQNGRK